MKGDLPEAVQEALGDLAGAVREGLLALSVGVGLGVVHELMEAEVTEVCGPKGKNDPDRKAGPGNQILPRSRNRNSPGMSAGSAPAA